MTTGYSPLHFMEALARERRTNRRSSAGQGAASYTTIARQRLARAIITLGLRLKGEALPRITNA